MINAREQGKRDQASNRAIYENPFPLYSDDFWKWKLGWYEQEMKDIEEVLYATTKSIHNQDVVQEMKDIEEVLCMSNKSA